MQFFEFLCRPLRKESPLEKSGASWDDLIDSSEMSARMQGHVDAIAEAIEEYVSAPYHARCAEIVKENLEGIFQSNSEFSVRMTERALKRVTAKMKGHYRLYYVFNTLIWTLNAINITNFAVYLWYRYFGF